MKYIIANWKANKTLSEVKTWLNVFSKKDLSFIKSELQIIICPPYPFLSLVKEKLQDCSYVKIGSQDISFFEKGAYTGEVSVENLSDLVDYALIGHSERRYYFEETARILFQKFNLALDNNIKPIFCIRSAADIIPERSIFVAYEPVYAIGTGRNESLDQILKVKKNLSFSKDVKFIYGGSVNENNSSYYLKNQEIDGLLVGGASLSPEKFYKIIKQAGD